MLSSQPHTAHLRSAEMNDPEVRRAIAEVQRLVDRWAITPRELEALSRWSQRQKATARENALHTARQLAQFWEMTEQELGGRPRRAKAAPQTKYVHPETGEAWDGVGQQPQWLRRALLREGLRVAELAPAAPT